MAERGKTGDKQSRQSNFTVCRLPLSVSCRKASLTLTCSASASKATALWRFTNVLLLLLIIIIIIKDGEGGFAACLPSNFVGEQLLPCFPVPAHMLSRSRFNRKALCKDVQEENVSCCSKNVIKTIVQELKTCHVL